MKKNISLIVSFIGVFIIGVIIGRFILAPHPPLADDNRPVYPTIYKYTNKTHNKRNIFFHALLLTYFFR
ncbi:hypothetical protein ACI3SI_01485, partial [Lactococcus lactis]